jgi:hypothetical protein
MPMFVNSEASPSRPREQKRGAGCLVVAAADFNLGIAPPDSLVWGRSVVEEQMSSSKPCCHPRAEGGHPRAQANDSPTAFVGANTADATRRAW